MSASDAERRAKHLDKRAYECRCLGNPKGWNMRSGALHCRQCGKVIPLKDKPEVVQHDLYNEKDPTLRWTEQARDKEDC